jgi:hypothetical protein
MLTVKRAHAGAPGRVAKLGAKRLCKPGPDRIFRTIAGAVEVSGRPKRSHCGRPRSSAGQASQMDRMCTLSFPGRTQGSRSPGTHLVHSRHISARDRLPSPVSPSRSLDVNFTSPLRIVNRHFTFGSAGMHPRTGLYLRPLAVVPTVIRRNRRRAGPASARQATNRCPLAARGSRQWPRRRRV